MLPIKKQKKTVENKVLLIIKNSLESGKDLDSLLNESGFSYNDLRYKINPPPQFIESSYKSLELFNKPFNGIPVVSFFSGCGGLDLGFESAGFEHRVLIEHNELFCDTLRHNRDWEVIGPPYADGDMSNRYEIASNLKKHGVKNGFNGVFIGGPPCQPFSIASNQRFSKNGENFKRVGFSHEKNGNLLFDFVWQIKHFKPKVFLIENVPGLIELDDGKQVKNIYDELSEAGYTVNQPFKVNAAHYSVPQNRGRVFIIGYLGSKKLVEPQKSSEIVSCLSAISSINETFSNHVTRKHKANSVARYIELDVGKRDKLGRVDRLDPSLPSKTVIAGGTAGGGRSHLHPYIPRTLSVRECARLQTFPDNYEFTGSSARQFTQVGNAVPPVLAAQLATAIYESYFSCKKKT
jgi:DNA (cytosine-5)-methyltransferase 1